MAQSFDLHQQAERCRRLARDSTDIVLRDSLLKLAEEYTAHAATLEAAGDVIQTAGPEEQGAG
jgi:hypothetical protein